MSMILSCARVFLKAIGAIVVLARDRRARRLSVSAPSLPRIDGDGRRSPASRRRSTSSATPTPSPTSSRPPRLDALFGLGYVHAQDRLWQMEFQRRIGHGRLSEIFGAATLPQDRFLRTVGFGRAATTRLGRLAATGRSSRSTPTSPASTRSSRRITAARCRRSSRCCASSPSPGPAPTSSSG